MSAVGPIVLPGFDTRRVGADCRPRCVSPRHVAVPQEWRIIARQPIPIVTGYSGAMIPVRNRVAGVTRFCDVAILGCLAKK